MYKLILAAILGTAAVSANSYSRYEILRARFCKKRAFKSNTLFQQCISSRKVITSKEHECLRIAYKGSGCQMDELKCLRDVYDSCLELPSKTVAQMS